MTGSFITFEGIDGSGKTTQISLFENYLRSIGVDCITTREPGGSRGAEEIRSLLVKGTTSRWSPETETLLFFASRRDHLEKTIIPALQEGKVVICDRFTDTTRVYQGLVRSKLRKLVDNLHQLMIGLEPDLTFILDMTPKEALKRSLARKTGEDRFEEFGEIFHEQAREGFLELSIVFSERCKVINAKRSQTSIAEDIISHYRKFIQIKSLTKG